LATAAVVVVAGIPLPALASGPGWKVVSSPNASGAQTSRLWGDACSSTKVCVAVGTYTSSGGTP
jgi:hypothetical protein